ncbi:MAG: hypothetical protein Q9219_006253 [cf. Caloplaca sp. 3 TL-2023]
MEANSLREQPTANSRFVKWGLVRPENLDTPPTTPENFYKVHAPRKVGNPENPDPIDDDISSLEYEVSEHYVMTEGMDKKPTGLNIGVVGRVPELVKNLHEKGKDMRPEMAQRVVNLEYALKCPDSCRKEGLCPWGILHIAIQRVLYEDSPTEVEPSQ